MAVRNSRFIHLQIQGFWLASYRVTEDREPFIFPPFLALGLQSLLKSVFAKSKQGLFFFITVYLYDCNKQTENQAKETNNR